MKGTLPYDHFALAYNIGYRAPLRVRMRLRVLGLRGRAQRCWYDTASGEFHAWGWKIGGERYFTSVHPGLRRGDSYKRRRGGPA